MSIFTTTRRWPPGRTVVVGGFFLVMGGVHLGTVNADPHAYAWFGENASLGIVRSAWNGIFMANPTFWGLVMATLQVGLGMLLLLGGPAAKVGWVGVLVFHAALIGMGWIYLLWSIPVGLLLLVAVQHDWRFLTPVPSRRR